MTMLRAPLSVYIHYPYCKRICPYCDFNKYLDSDDTVGRERFTRAVVTELTTWSEIVAESASTSSSNGVNNLNNIVQTIYFGGGTPSLARASFHDAVIGTVRRRFACSDVGALEVTCEVNPNDALDTAKLKDLRDAGINRVSLGVQSFDDDSLQLLGRTHSGRDARQAIENARRYFDNVSVDFIYGLPQHRLKRDAFANELRAGFTGVLQLASHLSLYSLTIERNTLFQQHVARGDMKLPSADESAQLYLDAVRLAQQFGFERYEISNFARDRRVSQHNLNFWNGGQVIGCGPGAATRLEFSIKSSTGTTTPSSSSRAFERLMRYLQLSQPMQQQWLARRRRRQQQQQQPHDENDACDDAVDGERIDDDGDDAIYFAGKNLRVPERYAQAIEASRLALDGLHSAPLNARAHRRELALLGLRLVAGVRLPRSIIDLNECELLRKNRLLEYSKGEEKNDAVVFVRLLPDALLLADEISNRIIK